MKSGRTGGRRASAPHATPQQKKTRETQVAYAQRFEKARREAERESLDLDRLLAEGAVPEK